MFFKKGDLVYIPSNTAVYIRHPNPTSVFSITLEMTHKPQHGIISEVQEGAGTYEIKVHIPEYGNVYIRKGFIYEPLKGVKNADLP